MKHPIEEIVDELSAIAANDRGQWNGYTFDSDGKRLNSFRNISIDHMYDEDDDWFVLVGDDCNPSVIWPIDVSLGFRYDDGTWMFSHCTSIKPRQARGRARLFSPIMLQRDVVELQPDGRSFTAREIMSYMGGKWVDANFKTVKRQHDFAGNMPVEKADHWNNIAQINISQALRERYEWSVSVGEPDGPSFRFATDATGIKQMLDERDKGSNGRRAALRGWVTDHWRQSRSDADVEVYVRKHLRGGEMFHWRGFECVWSPSAFDLDRNEAYKAERQMMGRQAKRIRP